MKKITFILKKLHLIIFLLCIFCIGCTNKNSNCIYQPGREWIFDAYFYNENKELTNNFEVKMKVVKFNSRFLFFWRKQKGLNYEYCGIKQETTIRENKNYISFFSPRLGNFDFTSILPSPTISLPPDNISKSTIKSNDKGMSDDTNFANLIFTQEIKQNNETEYFEYNGKQLLCYKVEGLNTNYVELFGQHKVSYFFNDRFGFVRFLYEKPDGSIVEMRLKKTNFD